MATETIDQTVRKDVPQSLPTPDVGLNSSTNADTLPAQAGKLPEKPQTLKTFMIDLDDSWTLP